MVFQRPSLILTLALLACLVSTAVSAPSPWQFKERTVAQQQQIREDESIEMAVGRDALGLMEKTWLEAEQATQFLVDREVINCDITSPTAGQSLISGQKAKVTWDKSCVNDPKFADYTGTILLGYSDHQSPGYNLDLKAPLAKDFKLSQGSKTITIPKGIQERNTYFVVLMGDSGNKSPEFAIRKPSKDKDNTSIAASSSDSGASVAATSSADGTSIAATGGEPFEQVAEVSGFGGDQRSEQDDSTENQVKPQHTSTSEATSPEEAAAIKAGMGESKRDGFFSEIASDMAGTFGFGGDDSKSTQDDTPVEGKPAEKKPTENKSADNKAQTEHTSSSEATSAEEAAAIKAGTKRDGFFSDMFGGGGDNSDDIVEDQQPQQKHKATSSSDATSAEEAAEIMSDKQTPS